MPCLTAPNSYSLTTAIVGRKTRYIDLKICSDFDIFSITINYCFINIFLWTKHFFKCNLSCDKTQKQKKKIFCFLL